MTNEEKLNRYDYAVYMIKEIVKTYLEDDYSLEKIIEEKDVHGAFCYGRIISYLCALYYLTGEEKWMKNVSELKE